MTSLQPLNNSILFKFLDETKTSDGKFVERSRSSIIIGSVRGNQTSEPRWGEVIAIGPKVLDTAVGEFILIEAGKWTIGVDFQDEGKVWKTDEGCVMLSTTDLSATYSY
jgi:co-chaperonin GroES (HSP10)